MVLKKELALYERDEEGKLIPQEVKLEIDETDESQLVYKDETVFVTPMSRGEIKRVFTQVAKGGEDKDLDGELIIKHLRNPTFTEKDLEAMKPVLSNILVNTIFRESGVNLGKGSKKIAIQEAEDEFAKN